MVRDPARSLSKEAAFADGRRNTSVDRDMLRSPETFTHFCATRWTSAETPDQRRVAGNHPPESSASKHGIARNAARQRATMEGHRLAALREAAVHAQLTDAGTVAKLSGELLEFLFSRASMKETVTEISGRGVGLDVVRSMVRHVRGTVRTLPAGQERVFNCNCP
jgi:two-component system sensor histidine kinase and response regulator WspE